MRVAGSFHAVAAKDWAMSGVDPGSECGVPRCVFTGIGVVSAAGLGTAAFQEAIERGEDGAGPLPRVKGPSHQPRIGAVLRRHPLAEDLGPLDRVFRMASAAVAEALADAGLAAGDLPGGCGLVLGTTLAGAIKAQRWHADLLAGRRPRRADLLQAPLHAIADYLGRRFGFTGPRTVVTNACVSGTNALGLALDLIRAREAEVVVAGGVDSLHSFNFTGFAALGTLTRDRCMPFDPAGRKMLLGEAAAFLVVESGELARLRGARVQAELAGYGCACDAFRITTPRPDGAGAGRAIGMALADAGVTPEEVDFVSLHGLGTPYLDGMESAALRRIFGDRQRELPASSLRPVTGHTLGGVGALDTVASVLAVARGFVPPTGRPGDRDPNLHPPIHLTRTLLRMPIRVALNTSSGFGGVNAALVVRRWEAEP
jgi:3-oxoacyl-[acyl-carrier-protein] synthase II